MRFTIIKHGSMAVESISIAATGPEVIAVWVNLGTKRGAVDWIGTGAKDCPTIAIESTPDSVNVVGTGETVIQFDDLSGWSVHSSVIHKSTLAVCFVKL